MLRFFKNNCRKLTAALGGVFVMYLAIPANGFAFTQLPKVDPNTNATGLDKALNLVNIVAGAAALACLLFLVTSVPAMIGAVKSGGKEDKGIKGPALQFVGCLLGLIFLYKFNPLVNGFLNDIG